MRQILAVAILGVSLASSAIAAFANDRNDYVPSSQITQSEAVVGTTESAQSMGAGIEAPQPEQGPERQMGGHK